MSHVLRWVLVGLLVAHGLIHLLGAAKGFGWAAVSQLKEPIGPGGGALWLLAAMLLVASAALLAAGASTWWWAVVPLGAVVSQIAIVTSWSDAKYGTVVNLILLLAAAYGFAALGPTSFHAQFRDLAGAAVADVVRSRASVGVRGRPRRAARSHSLPTYVDPGRSASHG